MTIEFTPRPSSGVHLASSDGNYLDVRIDRMQVIVVGPMRHSPVEYLVALREAFDNDSIELISAEFMRSDELVDQSPEVQAERDRIAMLRGFVSLMFEQQGVLSQTAASDEAAAADDGWVAEAPPEGPAPLAQNN